MKLFHVVLALAALSGLANIAPAGHAVGVGCIPGGNVLAPINAPSNGWTPDCVNVNPAGVVTWTDADEVNHDPALKIGSSVCFSGAEISTGTSTAATFTPASGGVRVSVDGGPTKFCAVGGTQNQGITDDGDHFTIHYWCKLHTTQMLGTVIVPK